MKRQNINWLIIFLGVVAIVGYYFTPAFAEDEITSPMTGIQQEDDSMSAPPLEDPEIFYDSFGPGYQYTWVGAADFVPDGVGPHYFSGPFRYRGPGSASTLVAPLRLPSGALLFYAQLYYYDGSSNYYAAASLYRYESWTSSENLGRCQSSVSETPYNSFCTFTPNHTIRNRDNIYQLYVILSGEGDSVRFRGVRLYWKRQIRTGLSHPFTDIGWMPALFQNSIAALYASGITSGCSSTQYCPNDPVTRGQMAVFLARALGLYWSYWDGGY